MLREVIQSCEQISKELGKKLKEIPKNQSCAFSLYPNKMWCEELNKFPVYGVCEKCTNYLIQKPN